jgi:type I restriction enzyme S subunit
VKDYLYKIASATTVTIVNKSKFQTTPFPLPPLPEQHRIVAEIEKQLTRLDAGVAALRRAQAKLRRYKAAVLKAACEGRLVPQDPADEPAATLLQRILAERRQRWEAEQIARGKEPKKLKYKEPAPPDTSRLQELPVGWIWTKIEQLGEVIGGLTKNSKRKIFPLKMPYLRVANVYANELQLDDVQEIGVKESELERITLEKGDLLVVEGNGSIEQIGRVAIWDGSISPCVHQNHIIKVRFKPVDLAKFILLWLLSKDGREQIMRVASSTSGLYTLSLSKVAALPIPLPSLSEQQRIVAEVERRLSVVEELEAAVEANLKRAGRLRQAILKRAFEGKLVPQDPSDEPASLLLECIRAAREGPGAGGKNNRKSSRQQKRRRGKVSDKQLRLL